MILLSYIKTPLYTDAIFLNLEIIFNYVYNTGISVSVYFIAKWLKKSLNNKIFMGALCIGILEWQVFLSLVW